MKTWIGAKLFAQDGGGSVLLLRRSNTHPRYPLQWDIPGGFVEAGEAYEAALQRELREETGLELVPESVKLCYAKTDFYEHGSSTGEPETVIRLYYTGQVRGVRPEAVVSWEHDQAAWVLPRELAGRLAEPFTDAVRFMENHCLLAVDAVSRFTADK